MKVAERFNIDIQDLRAPLDVDDDVGDAAQAFERYDLISAPVVDTHHTLIGRLTIDDTMVLATVVAAREPKPGQSFFPLTVDYFEKFYAAGRIPGGFFKREGRPTEKETLTARLIDRPIRPLFPKAS